MSFQGRQQWDCKGFLEEKLLESSWGNVGKKINGRVVRSPCPQVSGVLGRTARAERALLGPFRLRPEEVFISMMVCSSAGCCGASAQHHVTPVF